MAAQQSLKQLGLWQSLQRRLARGNNVAQTFQLIVTGNCQAGFAALSQTHAIKTDFALHYGLVPQALYQPLIQSAVLLQHGAANPTAVAYLNFLGSKQAQDIIQQDGYSIPYYQDLRNRD